MSTEGASVEVKIGVQHAQRELVVETNETAESVEKLVAEAVAGGGLFSLTDAKGRKVFIPAERIAYVELGPSTVGHVGFRS
jgi:hypothetical protein